MENKNNHLVPKCLLKRWVVHNGKYDGVFVLDLKSKKIDFSYSSGRNAFSFASYNNFYILNETDRKTNLEKWFSGLENTLSAFIDKVVLKDTNFSLTLANLNRLMMGLVSFEFRSRYFFEKGIEYLEANQEIKNKFDGKSSLQIILENVVNATTNYSNQLFPVDLVCFESEKPLLLVDRPPLFKKIDNVSFIPLSPYRLLTFQKSLTKSRILFSKMDDDFYESLNNILRENAREWIVSIDKNELEQIRDNTSKFEFDDHVTFDEITTLLNGYEFNS